MRVGPGRLSGTADHGAMSFGIQLIMSLRRENRVDVLGWPPRALF
jgi:hypothetical protein